MWQAWTILDAYKDKLASNGFKTTTTTRSALYYDFERPLFSKLRLEYQEDRGSYDRIVEAIPRLRSLLAQSVDIQQEDHGKAILVFTIVTIIFLPMSFVAGFLGMNTRDIRALEESQWVFWAAAMPLTCVVVALSLWIGYRGESLSLRLWQIKRELLLARSHRENRSAVKYERSQDDNKTNESNELSRPARKLADAVHVLRSNRDVRRRTMNSQPEPYGQV